MSYRCQGHRKISAAKNAGAAHAKLKIRRRLKVDFETIDQWLLRQSSTQSKNFSNSWILSIDPVRASHFAHPILGAEWPKQLPQNARKLRGMGLINTKHIERLSVIAPQKWVLGGTEPQSLFAK